MILVPVMVKWSRKSKKISDWLENVQIVNFSSIQCLKVELLAGDLDRLIILRIILSPSSPVEAPLVDLWGQLWPGRFLGTVALMELWCQGGEASGFGGVWRSRAFPWIPQDLPDLGLLGGFFCSGENPAALVG